MIRLLVQILTLAGLSVAAVGLALLGSRFYQTPIALDAPATTPAPERRAPPPSAIPAAPALATFSQSLTRPLFFEGRRLPTPPPKQVKVEAPKPPPPPPPPPKPAVLPDKIKLLGVVLKAGDRQALIEVPPQPATWFSAGDRIAEWTISTIEGNQIVLSHPSNHPATLVLYSDASGK